MVRQFADLGTAVAINGRRPNPLAGTVGTLEEAGGTAEGIPVRCFGEPEELAALASFLLSDLSSFMNGNVVTFDGGEALAAGGQFNTLTQMPREQGQGLMEHMRPG